MFSTVLFQVSARPGTEETRCGRSDAKFLLKLYYRLLREMTEESGDEPRRKNGRVSCQCTLECLYIVPTVPLREISCEITAIGGRR